MLHLAKSWTVMFIQKQKRCLEDLLQLVVQHQHEGSAHASQNVGQRALEESLATLVTCDLPPAVDGAGVHNVGSFAARLHHHASTDSVEGIGGQTGHGCHGLSDGPADEDAMTFGVSWEHALGCVVDAEVGCPVDDDSLHGHVEALVQALEAKLRA